MILEFFFCVFVSMFFFPSCSSLDFVNFQFRRILKCILQFPSVSKTNKSLLDNNWSAGRSLIGRNAFLDLKFVRVNQKIDEIRFKMDLMLLGVWINAELIIQ